MDGLLHDIGVAVIVATLLGVMAHLLRQPIILGYLIAGAVIGRHMGAELIQEEHSVEIISEIGLVLLLFIIGLELNLKQVLASGRQLLVAGLGQFPICAGLGMALFWAMGFQMFGQHCDGLYLALMCGLSSTAIVVKLLYDKGELDTLAGRLTLGVLVMQDIFAIFILAFQPNFANPTFGPILRAMGMTVALSVAGFAFSRYALRWVFLTIAKAPEMVLAVSIAWCASVAGAASAMGLSKEMGSLVAGMSISAFPYSIHVTAKTLPLRDFFLTLFFVSLGMNITAPSWAMAGPVLAIVAFVVLSRFVSVYPLLKLSGAGPRAAFISSLNLSQVSEFSLVIAGLGLASKHIGQDTVAMITYAMAITAVLSSYGIRYNHGLFVLYDRLRRRLGLGYALGSEAQAKEGHVHPIAILGFHRTARALVEALGRREPAILSKIVVVDFNMEVLEELRGKGIAGIFGDISSLDTLEHAHLGEAKLLMCTIPDMLLKGTDNQHLVRTCRAIAPQAMIVATADDERHERRLRSDGASHVHRPHDLAGEHLAGLVAEALGGGEPAAEPAGAR